MRKKTHSKRADNKNGDFYDDIMDEIEKMPHVEQDLEELRRQGADPEKVLRFLATISFARGMRTAKVLKKQENKLRVAASELSRIGLEAGYLMLDEHSRASYWATILGHKIEDRIKWNNLPPTDAFEYIESCVKWMERNADALYHLRIAERKTMRTGPINGLFEYLKKSTGKSHTAVVTRLLNAAADALNSSDNFTEESLKKTRLRFTRQLRDQVKSLKQVETLLDADDRSQERDISS